MVLEAERQQAIDQDSAARIAAMSRLEVYVYKVKGTVLDKYTIACKLSSPDKACLDEIVRDAETYLEGADHSRDELVRYREDVKARADGILKRLLRNLASDTQRALGEEWEDCDILVTDLGRDESLDT